MLRTSAPLIGALGVIKMGTIRRLRIATSLVLLICFVLPMSKCTTREKDGSVSFDYQFPFENITNGIKAIHSDGLLGADSSPLIFATLIVFFSPIGLLQLSGRTQSILHICLGIPAEWLLYYWTTVGQPQIGGLLSMASWGLLMALGLISLRATKNAA